MRDFGKTVGNLSFEALHDKAATVYSDYAFGNILPAVWNME